MTTKQAPGDLNTQTWVYITFGERTYKLFWFKMANDGSLYLGLADAKPAYVVQGKTETSDFMSGAPMEGRIHGTDTGNVTKMSFHPSGKIHADYDRGTFDSPFWEVAEQRLLIVMIFRDTHRLAQTTRPKDFTRPNFRIIAEDWGLREDDSLQCAVLLRAPTNNELRPIDGARYVQFAKLYPEFEDERKKPMILHFLFLGKDADGKDHTHTLMIYPNIDVSQFSADEV